MYTCVTLDYIRNRLVKLWDTRKKLALQKEKCLPIVGLEPYIIRLLDLHSIQLHHKNAVRVKQKRSNEI